MHEAGAEAVAFRYVVHGQDVAVGRGDLVSGEVAVGNRLRYEVVARVCHYRSPRLAPLHCRTLKSAHPRVAAHSLENDDLVEVGEEEAAADAREVDALHEAEAVVEGHNDKREADGGNEVVHEAGDAVGVGEGASDFHENHSHETAETNAVRGHALLCGGMANGVYLVYRRSDPRLRIYSHIVYWLRVLPGGTSF